VNDLVVDNPGIVLPTRDCDAEQALDTAIQHARRATQMAVSSNPMARNHASAAAAWAQVAVGLLVRDGATVPFAAPVRTGEDQTW
jgi:hypothetical protein